MNSPLFQRQATGGVVARDGFEYQDAFLLEHLPEFLSQSAFSSAVSELMGDIEVRYHRPDGNTYCSFYEAKRNKLSTKNFWEEVNRFVEVHNNAPDEYVRFTLVCGDYHDDLKPMLNKVQRLRGPAISLNPDSAIRIQAEQEIRDNFIKLKQTATLANFVLQRVRFIKYDDTAADARFLANLTRCLPEVGDLRPSQSEQFLQKCRGLVASSFKGIVTRLTIETALVESIGADSSLWIEAQVPVRLISQCDGCIELLTLLVNAFNDDDRGKLGHSAWAELHQQATIVGEFIQNATFRRRIRLLAKHRISLAVVIGHAFSAVRGFKLSLEHNESVFDMANHAKSEQSFFQHTETSGTGRDKQGVFAIGFPSPMKADVQAACIFLGLTNLPALFLESTRPVADIATLNTAVEEAKLALVALRSKYQLEQTHVFIKGPAVFAMALGHRLNGVGIIKLYDWVDTNYVPTAVLT